MTVALTATASACTVCDATAHEAILDLPSVPAFFLAASSLTAQSAPLSQEQSASRPLARFDDAFRQ